MATSRMELKGARELGLKLRKMSATVARQKSHAAVSAGAEIIKALAVRNIEVNKSANRTAVDTGKLRDNVIQKRLPDHETRLTAEHIVTVRRKVVPYAILIEEGTVKMPAESFMRPAFDSGKEQAAQAIVDKLEQAIDEAW